MEKQKTKSAAPKGKTSTRTAKNTSPRSKVAPSRAPAKKAKVSQDEDLDTSTKSPTTTRRITNADEQKKAVNTSASNSYDEDDEGIDNTIQKNNDDDR